MSELCLLERNPTTPANIARPQIPPFVPAADASGRLFPADYRGEPADLPGLQMIRVPEIAQFAIVRFYAESSGAIGMVPLDYFVSRTEARRHLAMLRQNLARRLGTQEAPAQPIAAAG
jgi:hypothetical protein